MTQQLEQKLIKFLTESGNKSSMVFEVDGKRYQIDRIYEDEPTHSN